MSFKVAKLLNFKTHEIMAGKNMRDLDYTNYLSPFTWRYGSNEMRKIFSEDSKYRTWRKIWVALAKAQYKAGLLTKSELDDLEQNKDNIDIKRILEIEKETKHDLVAAIKEYAEKAKIGGGKIHLGATSMDIVDNSDILRIKDALKIVEEKIKTILLQYTSIIDKYSDHVCLGYTHLQAAEPTTIGYRFAIYAKDLLTDLKSVRFFLNNIEAKGFKGAVGTSASYFELLEGTNITPQKMEKMIMDELGLQPSLVSTQVYSRKLDFFIISVLASITSSLAKFAGDLRILQSPGFGEWSEPFADKQVGSSAMPFKKNPLNSEKISSLARYLSSLPSIALGNATYSYLERTLDDSANKRIIISESFLATDEVLNVAEKIIKGITFNLPRIKYNLDQFAPFSATEAIIVEVVKNGANRQEMHEEIRLIALKAWDRILDGRSNPMKILLCKNKKILKYLKVNKIIQLIKTSNQVGDAPDRALELSKIIKQEVKN